MEAAPARCCQVSEGELSPWDQQVLLRVLHSGKRGGSCIEGTILCNHDDRA